MAADLGFYLLLMCGILCVYGVGASAMAGLWRHRRLYRSARVAATLMTVLCVTASVLLWIMFFKRDYSVAYVWKNSSNDLPAFYTFTAFWCSLEGSHLLWTLLLSIFTSIALWTAARDNEHIMPWVSCSLMAVLSWMYYLLVTHSDPFVRMFPAHENGQGMNALLQNTYMAIHPPTLFTGYTALAIPAAYSIAALAFGDITEGWLRTVRRWSLFAFCALTAGIILGGRWAYVELGWAGYWAWDPVENSSMIPWLFATALLHSLVVQDKLGHLKRVTLILAFLGFYFSFFGTFITRSGIVSSVHSFAESPIGPNYLIFLAAMLLITAVLYGFRAHSILPPDAGKVWGVSKESALVVTLFLLLTMTAIVCVGTLYPIVSEALTGERTTVQAPYFNTFAPWIGLGIVVAIAVGNLMRYQSAKIPHGFRTMAGAAVLALPALVLIAVQGRIMETPKPFALGAQLVGIYLCAWSFFCLVFDVIDRLKDLRWSLPLFFGRNLAYFGGFVAHVGMLLAIVGFLGNYRGQYKVATMSEGEKIEFAGYTMHFDGLKVADYDNATHYEAHFRVDRGSERLGSLVAARSKYPTKAELHHEVGVLSYIWRDIYVTVSDFDRESGRRATFEMHINHTVKFVWIATVLVVLGGLISLIDRHRGSRSRDALLAWDMGVRI